MTDEELEAYRKLRDAPCSLAVALGLFTGRTSDFVPDEPVQDMGSTTDSMKSFPALL